MAFKFKSLIYSIFLLLVGLIVYLSSVFILTNPFAYKTYIENMLSNRLGHNVVIDGRINWSFYPVFGMTVQNMAIKNPQAGAAKSLAQFHRVHVGISTLPFVTKQQLKIKRFIIDQGTVNWSVDKEGISNWDRLLTKLTSNKNESATPDRDKKAADLAIQQILVNDLNVTLNHQQIPYKAHLTDVNLEIHNFHSNEPFFTRLRFGIDSPSHRPIKAQASANITHDANDGRILVDHFKIKLAHNQPVLSLISKGDIVLANLFDKPEIHGHLALTTNPNRIAKLYKLSALKRLGSHVKLNMDYHWTPEKISLTDIQGESDYHMLRGSISYILTKPKALNFNLRLNEIDLARLAGDGQIQPSGKPLRRQIPHPPYWLSQTQLNGQLRIGQLNGPIKAQNVRVNLHSHGNVFKLTNLSANVLGGGFSFHGTARYHGHRWSTRGVTTLRDINIDLIIPEPQGQDLIEGHLFTTLHFSTHGRSPAQMIRHFNGEGGLAIINGRMEAFRIQDSVQRALHHVDLHHYARRIARNDNSLYKKIEMNYALSGQNVTTHHVTANTRHLTIKGQGLIRVNNQHIAYDVTVAPSFLPGLKIPLSIEGTYKDPSIDINFTRLVKIYVREFEQGVESVITEVGSGLYHFVP